LRGNMDPGKKPKDAQRGAGPRVGPEGATGRGVAQDCVRTGAEGLKEKRRTEKGNRENAKRGEF